MPSLFAFTHSAGSFRWRLSLVVMLLGVVTLLAGVSSEQHRQLQISFAGQIESVPAADLSQLLHSSHGWINRLSPGRDGNNAEDDDKSSSQALLLNSNIFSLSNGGSSLSSYSPFAFYQPVRTTAYNPRAPPFA